MANINTIETESIQVGRAPAPPIAAVDIWPSLDPTVPFSQQVNGINNFLALTNQIGLYNGIGLQSITGLTNLFGLKSGVGGEMNAQPAFDSAAIKQDLPAVAGDLWGNWKLNNVNIQTTSDIKNKTNIKPLEGSLEKVLKLQGVEYDRTDYKKHEIGLIAQEVEKVIPDLVDENSEKTKLVHYQNLTAVLVEAVKEQQKQIEELKETVQELSTKLAECCS